MRLGITTNDNAHNKRNFTDSGDKATTVGKVSHVWKQTLFDVSQADDSGCIYGISDDLGYPQSYEP